MIVHACTLVLRARPLFFVEWGLARETSMHMCRVKMPSKSCRKKHLFCVPNWEVFRLKTFSFMAQGSQWYYNVLRTLHYITLHFTKKSLHFGVDNTIIKWYRPAIFSGVTIKFTDCTSLLVSTSFFEPSLQCRRICRACHSCLRYHSPARFHLPARGINIIRINML